MFKLDPNPTFKATAKIPAPGGEPQDLACIFRHKSRDDLQAFVQKANAGDLSDLDATMEFLAGWEDADAEFSREAVNKLLQGYHGSARALYLKYLEELTQARLGN